MKITKEVKGLKNGDQFIQFTPEELEQLGWKTGDVLDWNKNKDGTFVISKKEMDTEFVMVETELTYKMKYCVEVPKGKPELGVDLVKNQLAKEFSQTCLGEEIVNHKLVTKKEAIKICKKENDYCSNWDEETIMNAFFANYKDTDPFDEGNPPVKF